MTRQLSISRRELIVGGLVVAFAVSARARAATSEATGPNTPAASAARPTGSARRRVPHGPNAIGGFVRISQEESYRW